MDSVGLDKILQQLKDERDRFFKAGKSGKFCDSEKCVQVACVIDCAITELKHAKKHII